MKENLHGENIGLTKEKLREVIQGDQMVRDILRINIFSIWQNTKFKQE